MVPFTAVPALRKVTCAVPSAVRAAGSRTVSTRLQYSKADVSEYQGSVGVSPTKSVELEAIYARNQSVSTAHQLRLEDASLLRERTDDDVFGSLGDAPLIEDGSMAVIVCLIN